MSELVICSRISVTSSPGREFARDHRQFVPTDAGNGPIRSHRPQAEEKCPAKSEEGEDHPEAAAEEASDEASGSAEDTKGLFSRPGLHLGEGARPTADASPWTPM